VKYFVGSLHSMSAACSAVRDSRALPAPHSSYGQLFPSFSYSTREDNLHLTRPGEAVM
jgi:hypothetical protein